jgi:hypothetical protein
LTVCYPINWLKFFKSWYRNNVVRFHPTTFSKPLQKPRHLPRR